jgi:hypothetical protein
MDDELQQLENELKRLRPAAPTRDFLARIERELSAPAAPVPVRRPAPLRWLWAGALPAAAALAVVIMLAARNRPQSTVPTTHSDPVVTAKPPPTSLSVESPAAFKPVAAENVLYAAQDEGLVTLDDGTPARRERLNYVDTIVWKNPRTNASVRWTVPREEVRVVPVKFQ